ncbi:MAG: IS5 family transposase [Burkholderiaceae bacterium]|nr:MAG: IS5 family transposase [Burkholderiaceae bacterium]
MAIDDFFRARIDQMIDMAHPLAVLARRLPWASLEATLAPCFARTAPAAGEAVAEEDLFGAVPEGVTVLSNAGRPRLAMRLMISLLYLKHAFNLSDEELVARWSENVVWQYFSGREYYEPRLPCDATQLGRFRAAAGEAGVEEILKATIDTAVTMKAIKPAEFKRVIVDTTVQPKAIAHPTDSRLLEAARRALVKAAGAAGIELKQTFAKEGKHLRWKAGRYGHARQFRRLAKVARRQRTIVGRLLREIERKAADIDMTAERFERFNDLLQRCERIRTQGKKSKAKLYALHAPEVECIAKGKARTPYEFGVKAAVAVTHKSGLMVGARTFPGNPYDGHILAAQIEQTNILLQATGREVKEVFADLGFRGVDQDNPGVEITHRGKYKRLTKQQRKWLRRRSAVEPAIGHTKSDCRMDRCWLKGQIGDALHAVLCAAGYNIRWLLRAIARLGLKALYLRLVLAALSRSLRTAADDYLTLDAGQRTVFG